MQENRAWGASDQPANTGENILQLCPGAVLPALGVKYPSNGGSMQQQDHVLVLH